jgi:hypothetical protein
MFVISPTELQYLVLAQMFHVLPEQMQDWQSLNMTYNAFVKYQSTHIHEKFMLYLLYDLYHSCGTVPCQM